MISQAFSIGDIRWNITTYTEYDCPPAVEIEPLLRTDDGLAQMLCQECPFAVSDIEEAIKLAYRLTFARHLAQQGLING